MLTFPAHACFFLRPLRPGGKPQWSAASLARAIGADFLSLGQVPKAGRGAALHELERHFSDALANGREIAVDTSGMRREEVGHLKNLARRGYLTPVDVAPGDCSPNITQTLEITRVFPNTFRPWVHGPFDVIGDIHDCSDELVELLAKLGYWLESRDVSDRDAVILHPHPMGRRLVFLGDFTDRGPHPLATLRIVMAAWRSGALAVLGNHDKKLLDYLNGKHLGDQRWFAKTARAVATLGQEERNAVSGFLSGLPSHLVLDDENLVVAHAGCRAAMQGRDNEYVAEFCMYGESSGCLDQDGYPIRADWAADYDGNATVVYGHITSPVPRWNGTRNALCIDTGCCLGGALTAFRWPERTLVSVPAKAAYTELAGFRRQGHQEETPQ